MTNDFKNNVKLNYLYRDAGNYKIFGSVVFANPENIDIEMIRNEVQSKLIDGEFFLPSRWQIAPLGFEEWNDDLDHFWNEFDSLQFTNESPTTNKTVTKFLADIS